MTLSALALLVVLPALQAPAEVRYVIHQEADGSAGRVERREGGKVVWSTRLEGYLGDGDASRPLWDAKRVYLTQNHSGVTSLDAVTGRQLWHAQGPGDRLFLSSDLLLAADCLDNDEVEKNGRWLVARRAETGAEAFRVRLSPRDYDVPPLKEVGGLFVVNSLHTGAALFDRQGRVRLRFEVGVAAGLARGADLFLLVGDRLVRVSKDDRILWSARVAGTGAGGLLVLPDGDLVAHTYGPIQDSGVGVARVRTQDGSVVWRTQCNPLGVSHSIYLHEASVAVEAKRLRVKSVGSYGRFEEVLDLATGKQLSREQSKDGGVG